MSSDRPVRTNCYVKGHLGGSNCPQCRAWQQLQPPEQPSPASPTGRYIQSLKQQLEQAQQRIAKLEKQLKAATSCFGRYGKIEFDVLESRAEQAEAERDALKARLQQLEGALRRIAEIGLHTTTDYSECVRAIQEIAEVTAAALTPPAAGEEG